MKDLEKKTFEIKSFSMDEESKEMFITGYGGVFNIEDALQKMHLLERADKTILLSTEPFMGSSPIMVRDILRKGASVKTISERGHRIAFCLNHEIDEPIGKIKELYEDETGIFLNCRISDSEGDIKIKIDEEIYREMSIGFVTVKFNLTKQSDGTYIRDLLEIMLYEISLVTIGRSDKAIITEVKSQVFFNELIESLLIDEKNEVKKFKLMKLKSLISSEPPAALAKNEPTQSVNELNKMFN